MAISVLHCVICEDRYDIRGDTVDGKTVRCPECGEKLTQDLSDWGGIRKKRDQYRKKTLANCKLKKRLWAGPDSITYRAEHRDQDMPVLFELWPHDQDGYDEEWIRRLFRGIAAASELRHPNIVVTYDLGRRKDFDFCMREIADGGAVRKWIEKRGRVRLNEALPVIEDALRVLRVAERKDLYSGRVNPDTFLLDYDDSLKMEYFGRPYHSRELKEFTVTPWGNLTGPCYYVAPEQVDDPDNGSIQADLYSVGLTLYEMLSGKRAYDGESAEEIAQRRLHEQPVAISTHVPDLPQEICQFIGDLTARDPGERPENAANALERFRSVAKVLNERPGLKDAPTIAEKQQAQGQHIRAIMWTVLAFFLIGVSIIPFYTMFTEESEAEKQAKQAQKESPGQGRVLVVNQSAQDSGVEDNAFGSMAALQLDALGGLDAVDPYLTGEMIGQPGGLDRALLKTDPTYVLEVSRSEKGLKLQFRTIKGYDWRVERSVQSDSIASLKEGLDTLLKKAAEKLEVSQYRPLELPGEKSFWSRLSQAQLAERDGEFGKAVSVIDDMSDQVPVLPEPVKIIRHYCSTVQSWRDHEGNPTTKDITFSDDLSGEWAALARVLEAISGGKEMSIQRELAEYLSIRPYSPRGYYLLGLWRLRSDMPDEEALAAWWQGVESDPGYLPNIYAIVDRQVQKGQKHVEQVLAKYREKAWQQQQIKKVEQYVQNSDIRKQETVE